MDDSKRLYQQLQEEREKQRLAKEVLMAERELEPKAQGKVTERLEITGAPTKGVALQEAEKLVERITQEHARLAAAQQNPELTLKDKDDFKLKDPPQSTWEEELKEHTKRPKRWGGIIGGIICMLMFGGAELENTHSPAALALIYLVPFTGGVFIGRLIAEYCSSMSFNRN